MPVTITNNTLTATIAEKGAELISLQKQGKELIWEGNPYYWGKHSPVLFPIVGTLKNNRYTTRGRQYEMGRHGFARDMSFKVSDQSDDRVTSVLTENESTLAAYPFAFELKMHYLLNGPELEITYEVTNTGNKLMPYSLGAHPAFALDSNIENYSLAFAEDDEIVYHHLKDDLICRETSVIPLSRHQLMLSSKLFENDALVIKSLRSREVTLLKNNRPILTVALGDFPNLGLWTKPGAPFICIEPWQGYADSVESQTDILEEKEGIRLLDISDMHSYKLRIKPEI